MVLMTFFSFCLCKQMTLEHTIPHKYHTQGNAVSAGNEKIYIHQSTYNEHDTF
jgi:hypothetical protein